MCRIDVLEKSESFNALTKKNEGPTRKTTGGGGEVDSPPTTRPEIGLSALNSPELTGQPNPSAMVDISFS